MGRNEPVPQVSSRFGLDAPNAALQDPTKPLDLQHIVNVDMLVPGLRGPSSTNGTSTQMVGLGPPPLPSVQPYHIPPSAFLRSGENFFMTQPKAHPSHTVTSGPVTPNPVPSTSPTPFPEDDRIVPICHRDHAKERSTTTSGYVHPTAIVPNSLSPLNAFSRIGRRPPSRVCKRHSPYPCAIHCVAEPPVLKPTLPTRKRKRSSSSPSSPSSNPNAPRPKKPRTTMTPPLPDTLLPIRVPSASGSIPRCPMPKCGASIEPCDAAWRGHFKAVHHDDLCLTPSCAGPPSPSCKARCPCPIVGGKACERTMGVESVGRHLLNIHIGVAYRCPVCGMEREWRESACARHIRLCLKKEQDGKKRDGP